MGALQSLNTILPLAFTSGINLYLTVLVIGLSVRYSWIADVPQSFHVLAAPPVLIAAAVLYALEFFADKIPFIDNLWDLIHTFIRPLGAILLTVIGFTGLDIAPAWEVVAALTASVVALTSHSGKAGTRTVINTTSPLENLTNIIISLLEDLLVAGLVFLSLLYPTIANALTIVLLVLIVVFVPQLLRWLWFTLRAIFAYFKAFVRKVDQSEPLPFAHTELLANQRPDLSIHAQAQGIRGASGHYGHLSLLDDRLLFTYNRWFRSRLWTLNTQRIDTLELSRRPLMTVLKITYLDEQHRPRTARFAFLRDREPLLNRLVARLGIPGTPLPQRV
jgi:hypothetical protein